MKHINREYLSISVSSSDGTPKEYRAPLKALLPDCAKKSQILSLVQQLRQTLRAQNNLCSAIKVLTSLRSELKSKHPAIAMSDFSLIALFSYSTTLYGACFVKGEDNRPPLDFLPKEILQTQAHTQLRAYRDKLFGHLDVNHEARTDNIDWTFSINGSQLTARHYRMSGSYTALPSDHDIEMFMDQIRLILPLLDSQADNITKNINNLVGTVEIADSAT